MVLPTKVENLQNAITLVFNLLEVTRGANVTETNRGVVITAGLESMIFDPNSGEYPIMNALVVAQRSGSFTGSGASLNIVVAMLRRARIRGFNEQLLRHYPSWDTQKLSMLILYTMGATSYSFEEALTLIP